MASQNLPGFAVLRASGYTPPVQAALGVTGIGSAVAALFGAHTFNMAAITAAICLGDDVHPDKSQRWKVGIAYAFFWAMLGCSARSSSRPSWPCRKPSSRWLPALP
jgi:benzoate membrane transport protein